jgi:hypothetical protein
MTGWSCVSEALVTDTVIFLEPGGYLQWDEIDTEGLHIDSPESVSCDAVSKLFRATKIPKGTRGRDEYVGPDLNAFSGCSLALTLLSSWKWNLGSYLSAQGFSKSDLHTFKYDGAASRFWHDM